eukprot:1157531-Pelagomonas_calceolata.AAC.5
MSAPAALHPPAAALSPHTIKPRHGAVAGSTIKAKSSSMEQHGAAKNTGYSNHTAQKQHGGKQRGR